MLLLNPGPVTLTERVRRSMLKPDLCHRESEFFDLQDEIRTRLLSVYKLPADVWTAVPMTSSGTAAVESMIASLVPAAGRLLIVENGVYGERIAQMAAQYGISHERLMGDWMQPPDTDAIAARLDKPAGTGRLTHLAVVHHETTTGRLNDIADIARVCRGRDVQMLIDGVSSFGGEYINFNEPCLSAVAATANKCLHGVPGVAFVISRRVALNAGASRTYYLDLSRLARLQDARNTPFTPAVHACYALVEALREYHEQGGLAARHAHYAALAELARVGLARLGMPSVLPPKESSVVLRAYGLPAKLSYVELHDGLKNDGFVIYAGQGNLASTLFRISTMGDITTADINRLVTCFERLVQ